MKRALLFSLFLVGCTHHVRIDNPYYRAADVHKTWVPGFLWNLVGGRVTVTEFCGDRPVAAIDTKRSFGNAIVSWLTLGIYTPMHATITCGEMRQQSWGQAMPHMGTAPVVVQPGPVYAVPPPANAGQAVVVQPGSGYASPPAPYAGQPGAYPR